MDTLLYIVLGVLWVVLVLLIWTRRNRHTLDRLHHERRTNRNKRIDTRC